MLTHMRTDRRGSMSALAGRRQQQRVAGGALRVGRIDLGADAVELRLQTLHRGVALAVGVPVGQLAPDALQRARAAPVEGARLRAGFARSAADAVLLDARRVLRRQVDQRAR